MGVRGCVRCGKRLPPLAAQHADAHCSRECAERDSGAWERSQHRRHRLLLLTSRHHRALHPEPPGSLLTGPRLPTGPEEDP